MLKTTEPLLRRSSGVPVLIAFYLLAVTIPASAGPQEYSDHGGFDSSPQQGLGEDVFGQANPGQSSLAGQCSGPNPGPECGQLPSGRNMSTITSGVVPQIVGDESEYNSRSPLKWTPTYKLAPQRPTDFQNLVLQSTGQRLPIFGSNLFTDVPSTFAPLDRAPVPADYVIGPGDQLLIRGWGQVDINLRATVDRSGNVYIPRVGEVSVAGVKFNELTPYLKGVVSRTFRNFDLSVSMGQLRSIQVLVVGRARRPGSYTVSSLSTLVNAIFYCGGPLNTGSMRRIQLRRNDAVLIEFDLYDLLLKGDKSKDVALLPGDIIFIPPVGPQVAIAGSVNTPAIYELKGETSLGEAVKLAGGFTVVTDNNKATIERVEKNDHSTFRRVDDVPLTGAGLDQALHNGDIIRIAPMLPRFENTLTLRGNVAWPGRYPWHEGMRIRDLIPNKEALLTRDFWRQQNSVYSASGELPSPLNANTGLIDLADVVPGEMSPNASTLEQKPGTNSSESTTPVGAVNKAVQAGNTSASSRNNTETESRQATYAASTVSAGETRLRNDIKSSAPEINWDYAVIQRINRTDLSTELIPFNLGKAILDDDESQNLLLLPGDIVTIFSQQDIKIPVEKSVKFVRLEGEFVASGVYRVEPGETLRKLIERVGGLSPNAYLFGSEFTRESTKERQQQELNRMVNDLEIQVERNATTGASSVASADEAALLAPSLEGQRRLVEKLRQLKPTGRIVLELPGPKATVADLPDIPLEDGDRLVVPYRPASVEVLGSVYNSNAFIWRSDKKVGDYLQAAGGPSRNADKKHIFVLRADGAVIANNSGSGFWGGGIDSYRLSPGDAVVVPEQLWKGNVQRSLRDWTQIFSQLALGAASIAVLAGL